jgi:hypothetical protein
MMTDPKVLDDIFKFYTENIEFVEGELNKAEFQNQNFDPEKATGRFIQGYASTPAWDSDGESVVKSGLDISYYANQGWLNWMHNNSPNHVIGIPVYSKIDHKGFFTKGMLFNNEMATHVWNLASELKDLGYPRRLGYSIEGKVVARSAINKSKIVKAKVTNVAITHIPVNTEATFELVAKSFVPSAYDDVVSYIMKDLSSLNKDALAPVAKLGLAAGNAWGSSNYDDEGAEALRVESLEGVSGNKKDGKAVVGNTSSSEAELEARLSSAYKSAHKSHTELVSLLKAVHPSASDVLLEEIVGLVYKADGIDNFIRIIDNSEVLK